MINASDNQPATKGELKTTENLLRGEIKKTEKTLRTELKKTEKSLRGEMLKLEERLENVEESQKRVETKLDKIAETLDGFVGRVDDLTVENEVGSHQTSELQIQVENHEKRIKDLESK